MNFYAVFSRRVRAALLCDNKGGGSGFALLFKRKFGPKSDLEEIGHIAQCTAGLVETYPEILEYITEPKCKAAKKQKEPGSLDCCKM